MSEEMKTKSNDGTGNNRYIDELLKNKVFKFFSEDTSSKIALTTAIVTLGSFVIKALDYIKCKGYLSVFALKIENVNYFKNYSFAEFLLMGMVFVGLMIPISIFYLMVEAEMARHKLNKLIYQKEKRSLIRRFKEWKKHISEYAKLYVVSLGFQVVINLMFSSFIIPVNVIRKSNLSEWVMAIVFLLVVELLVAMLICFANNYKRNVKDRDIEIDSKLKELIEEQIEKIERKRPMFINLSLSTVIVTGFMLIVWVYFSGVSEAYVVDEFGIIEEHYVIVYQNDEKYWTVHSRENAGVLYLETDKQKVIPIEEVEVFIKEFDSVKIEE